MERISGLRTEPCEGRGESTGVPRRTAGGDSTMRLGRSRKLPAPSNEQKTASTASNRGTRGGKQDNENVDSELRQREGGMTFLGLKKF
jgi:hypothetical protein